MNEGPDGLRAWCIALSVMGLNMISSGIWRSNGYLFVAFLDEYNIDRRRASMPFAIRMAVRNILGLVVGVLGEKYEVRRIVILGGITGTISCALCFFTTDIIWTTLIFGVINGASDALIIVLPYVLIGQYFNKYRTTASGLSYSGGSISSFMFPAMFSTLLNSYGINGTFLIIGGIILHSIPFAIILTKPDWMQNDRVHSKCTIHRHVKDNNFSGIYNDVAQYIRNSTMCDCSNTTIKCQKCNFITTLNISTVAKPHLPCRRTINSLNPEGKFIPSLPYVFRENCLSAISYSIVNDKVITLCCEEIIDIDLEYLKEHSDLVFEIIIMDLSGMVLSHPTLLREDQEKDIWHPSKNEIIQQIENVFFSIKETLEKHKIVNYAIRSNDKYIKEMSLNEQSSLKQKCGSLQNCRRNFKTLYDRENGHNTINSISNIYIRLMKERYILTKLQLLCKSDEIRIISHLSHHNPVDVLKVIFQVRGIHKLYKHLINIGEFKSAEFSRSMPISSGSYIKELSLSLRNTGNERNSLEQYIKCAIMLYKNPIYLMICFARLTLYVTMSTMLGIIIDFARDKGIQADDGKFLIGAFAIGDVIGRLCSGWITDCGYVTLPKYMLCALVCLGISTISVPFTSSMWTLSVSLFCFGITESSHHIRHPVLIAKYMNSQEQSIAIGSLDLPSALFNLFLPFYVGYFRDNAGCYDVIFYINGCVAILAGLSWIFEPYLSHKNISDSTNL